MYWIIIVIPFFVNFKRFLVNFFAAVTLWNLCQLLDFCQLFERLLWEPYCSTISYSRWGTLWMVNLFSFRDYFQLFYFFSALWFLSRFGFCQFLDFCQLFQDFFENNIGIQGEGYSGWWTHFHWEFIFHFSTFVNFLIFVIFFIFVNFLIFVNSSKTSLRTILVLKVGGTLHDQPLSIENLFSTFVNFWFSSTFWFLSSSSFFVNF